MKLYDQLSSWWTVLSHPDEYREEAALYTKALLEAGDQPARTLLELGSGGGNNASHMKAHFVMTLVEPAPGMLAESRKLNPDCEHLEGDMRTVRLGRTFDRVFIHDAIMYMTTLADLKKALDTAFIHCRPGGAALFAPDYVRETFQAHEDCGGNDAGNRGLRYLEWVWDPDPGDTTYTVDYAYLMRSEDGSVRVEHDRHIEGLFSRDDWMRLITEAGFQPLRVPLEHSELEPGSYEAFVGIKPKG
ncbi:MAG: methyltransferase domain-containing protein [Polyangiaceae bacterium]|nr:methyltransferase domain-containing protein [Polyangiaceae bacterium]